jgi:hypothetical protein
MRITSNQLVSQLDNLNYELKRPIYRHDADGKTNVGHLTLSRQNGNYRICEITSVSGGERILLSNLTAREADIAISAMRLANLLT